jgi:hypothetical protein
MSILWLQEIVNFCSKLPVDIGMTGQLKQGTGEACGSSVAV